MSDNKYQGKQDMKAGCYAIDKQIEVQLPLKEFYYHVDILDSIGQVKMTQVYYNDRNDLLDVQYIFPVPPDAAISNLQYIVNGNVNKAIIVQKQQAEKKYSQGLNQGRGVVYGQIQGNSKDYMKIKIGNVLKNHEIKIKLNFIVKMSIVYNSFYQFRLQSSMTPRYGKQLKKQQIQLHHDYDNYNPPNYKSKAVLQAICKWNLKLNLKSQRSIAKVQSTTHKIKVKIINDSQYQINIDDVMLPNKDFALLYTFQKFDKPTYAICHNDNKSSAVISFIPKFCTESIDIALDKAIKNKKMNVGLKDSKGQYIFLLDRSGSMDGLRIESAKRSLIIFLKSIPQDSYFNIISFGSRYQYVFRQKVSNQTQGRSRKYTKQNLQRAIKAIQKMNADLGGTEIMNPLTNVMTIDQIKGYPRLVFMLTDGAVSNVTQVIKFIKSHTQYSRVSSIGIGNGCSRDLIQNVAKKGKGNHIFIDDQQDPSRKIINLLQNSLTPIILDMKITFDKDKVQSITPNPQKLPYILKNDLANFYITFKGNLTQDFKIDISYRDSLGGNYTNKMIISPNKGLTCNFINTMVAYQKITALVQTYTLHQRSQQRIYYVKQFDKKKLNEQIIRQSIQNQILTQLTAFICVDSSYCDSYAKQIAKLDKKYIDLRPMIPHNHVQVKFVINGEDDGEESDQYIDQCAISPYQQGNQNSVGKKVQKQQPKYGGKYRPMKMLVKNAAEGKYSAFDSITKWPHPQRRLSYQYILKKQDINGSWTQDFSDSLQNTQMDGKKKMFNRFKGLGLSDSVIYTIIVFCHLKRVFCDHVEYNMITEKAKNYILSNCRLQWSVIMKEYNQFYNLAI